MKNIKTKKENKLKSLYIDDNNSWSITNNPCQTCKRLLICKEFKICMEYYKHAKQMLEKNINLYVKLVNKVVKKNK